MRTFAMLAAVLAAALVLSLAAGPASARNNIESNVTRFSTSGSLTLGAPGFPSIFCDTTFHMTVRSVIAKQFGAEAGSITESLITNCGNSLGGRATVSALHPLGIAYGSISGTLPTITEALFPVMGGFLIETSVLGLDARCLFAGTIGAGSAENPMVTMRVLQEEIPLATDLGGALECPEEGRLTGTETVIGTSIRLTLPEG